MCLSHSLAVPKFSVMAELASALKSYLGQGCRLTIDGWEVYRDQLCLEVTDVGPSSVAARAAREGSITVQGQTFTDCKDLPEWFHHGTGIHAGLGILKSGLQPTSKRPHTPHGVYSYSDAEWSESSMYNWGCIVHFKAHAVVRFIVVLETDIECFVVALFSRSTSSF